LSVIVTNKTSLNLDNINAAIDSVHERQLSGGFRSEEEMLRTVDQVLAAYEPYGNSNNITIHDTFDRANSANWPANIDCATTTHEVLHLVGLCDHYQERSLQYQPDPISLGSLTIEVDPQTRYDCREEYDGPNLMKDQMIYDDKNYRRGPAFLQMYRDFVKLGEPAADSRYGRDRVTCACPTNIADSACALALDGMASFDGDSGDPFGACVELGLELSDFQPNISYSREPAEFNVEARNPKDISFSYAGGDRLAAYNSARDVVRAVDRPQGLDMNQVEAILHPLCMTNPRARDYYDTSVNAYRDRFTQRGCVQ
ncbi:MAG: hypothetical protein MJK18_09835, partial [Bdellovibrionales bacterium]|nr:hypothetical protein [Bdellovibrionales bacterium]